MDICAFLRKENGNVYLRNGNNTWKRFDRILGDFLDNNNVKLKKKKFRIGGKSAWGGRHMGKLGDEIWLYIKMLPEEIERTFVYEVAGVHFEEKSAMKCDDDNCEILEVIAREIWKNKNCRTIIKDALIELNCFVSQNQRERLK